MPPTPRPPPALTCAEPGPWQFSQSNLPCCVFPIRPISVLPNASAWVVWQPKQTCLPTKVASTGALDFLPPAMGPLVDLAGVDDCGAEPLLRNSRSASTA